MPTNIEDFREITSAAQSGVVTSPTLPERDAFYEVGYLHRFPFGIVTKLSGSHKESTPGIDDNTIPGTAVITDVNISHIWVTGLEGVVEVRPTGRSRAMNLALNHAYGIGPITGGFFPLQTPPTYFDLDHDQRMSGMWNPIYRTPLQRERHRDLRHRAYQWVHARYQQIQYRDTWHGHLPTRQSRVTAPACSASTARSRSRRATSRT